MEPYTKTLLKEFDLRFTDCRSEVLDLFLKKDVALSHTDLEYTFGNSFDRATLYRTLKTFLDKGLLHKVLDDGSMKYALCKESCTIEEHNHEHVHFKCLKCGTTQCIDNIKVPSIKLPEGYVFSQANLLVEGICKDCEAKN